MVAGLLKFKEYFKDYADSYVLIGGAACDILFTENEADFRATRDLEIGGWDDFDLQKIAIPLSSVFPEQRIER